MAGDGSAEAYSRELARVAVAQQGEAAGLEGMQGSAHGALAELLLRHLAEAARLSSGAAAHAGRTDVNLDDLLLAFRDMGVDPGQLLRYVREEVEVPFAHPLASYPVERPRGGVPPGLSFRAAEASPPAGVPPGFPAFPGAHTFERTPLFRGAREEGRGAADVRREMHEQRVRGEAALSALHGRLEPGAPVHFAAGTSAWGWAGTAGGAGGGAGTGGAEPRPLTQRWGEAGGDGANGAGASSAGGEGDGTPGGERVRLDLSGPPQRKLRLPEGPAGAEARGPKKLPGDVTVLDQAGAGAGPGARPPVGPIRGALRRRAAAAAGVLESGVSPAASRAPCEEFRPVNDPETDPDWDRKKARAEKILKEGVLAAEIEDGTLL